MTDPVTEAGTDATPNTSTPTAKTAGEMGTAGDMLAMARRAVGMSLAEVATKTNVTEPRLRAIEAMDVAALPTMPFTLGFVRAYAVVLDLPADAMVARFREDAGYPPPSATVQLSRRRKDDLTPPAEVNVLAILGIVAFIVWMVWQILQAVAPTQTVEVEGTPLAGRIKPDAPIMYEVGTSLADEVPLVPVDLTPAPAIVSTEIGAVPVTTVTPGTLPAAQPAPGDIAIVYSGETDQLPASTATALQADAEAEPSQTAPVPTATAANGPSMAAQLNADALARIAANAQATAPTAATEIATPDSVSETSGDPIADLAAAATASLPDAAPASPAAVSAAVSAETAQSGAADATSDEAAAPQEGADPGQAPPTDPRVRLAVEPVYPTRCENGAAASETVTIAFGVSRYGKVSNPQVQDTTNSCFNRAAISALSRWDFEPATEAGRPVASGEQTTRVVFQLP